TRLAAWRCWWPGASRRPRPPSSAGAVGTGPWTRLAARPLLLAPSGPAAAGRPGSAGADRALLRRAERTPLAGRLFRSGSAGADRRVRPCRDGRRRAAPGRGRGEQRRLRRALTPKGGGLRASWARWVAGVWGVAGVS